MPKASVPFVRMARHMTDVVLMALLYGVSAWIGLALAFAGTNASPIWPAAGVALAALLLRGPHLWPGVWLGAFVANLVTFVHHHPAMLGMAASASALMATGNALGALVGWKICRWSLGKDEDGSSQVAGDEMLPRIGLANFALATLAAATASALIGPLAICLTHFGAWSDYLAIVVTWTAGDATGIILVTPFLLSWAELLRRRPGEGPPPSEPAPDGAWSRWLEPVLAFGTLIFFCWAVFDTPYLDNFPALLFKCIPFAVLTWIAMRMGVRGTTLGLMILATAVVSSGRRFFWGLDTVRVLENVVVWVGFLGVIALMFLALAVAVQAHRAALASLREAKTALEATMDAIPALVCVAYDRECRRISGNAPAHELLRVPVGRNLSKTAQEESPAYEVRIGGRPTPPEELPMHKAAATGQPVLGQEQELIFPNGDVRFIYGNAVPLLDERGASRGCVAAFVDVTERRSALKALEESEERFRAMADVAPVMIWMSDVSTRFTYFNTQWLEFTGRSMEQELGDGWAEGIHPDDREVCLRTYRSSFSARLEFSMEFRLRRKDGEYRWLLDHGVPRFGASGEFVGYIGSCMDITERRQEETDTAYLLGLSDLRRNAMTVEELIDGAVDTLGPHLGAEICWFAAVDPTTENFTIHRERRASGETLEGTYCMSTFGPDVAMTLRSGQFVAVPDVAHDLRTRGCADGYRRLGIGACAITPILREARVVALLAIASPTERVWNRREVSLLHTVAERTWLAMERLRLADELGASEARFRTMAEWVPVFIFTTEPDGGVDYINARFTAYTGIEPHAASGFGWMQCLHPDDRSQVMQQWRHCVETAETFSSGLRMASSEGDYRWFHCHAHPVYDAHFRIVKWFGTCADIHELMDSQRELKLLNERLEERVAERANQLMEANRELEKEFKERQRLEQEMLDVSERERRVLGQDLHDGLCQHLSGMAFMADTLSSDIRAKGLSEESERLTKLTSLIRSANTQARAIARGLHPVDVDANGLVAALRDLADRYSSDDGVQCAFICSRPVPLQDNNVALHLYRIAQEAVVNAIKHAAASEVVIELSSIEGEIALTVTDDGKGMPQEPSPSAGMGMHLMRYRAGVIGGELTLESPESGGTIVMCVLPVKEAERLTPATGPIPLVVRRQEDGKILIERVASRSVKRRAKSAR